MRFQLFHRLVDPGSARVRQFVVEHELTAEVKFRNVSFDEPLAELKARGADDRVPALWDGEQLFVGAEAVIARLRAHLDVGRGK